MKISELLLENQRAEFVKQNYDTAKAVGDQLGVDPKVILGHWALETGWGKSVIPGTNNLGNIKDFSGSGVRAYDKIERSNDAYRVYKDTGEFASDYANLLANRYPNVIGTGNDAAAFASGLQSGKYKYATGGKFDQILTQMPSSVEKYLGSNIDWKMSPEKMIATIQQAPKDIKNYISQNYPSVSDFIRDVSTALSSDKNDIDPEKEIIVIIAGKKLKFKTRKEAEKAIKMAQEKGLTVDV